MKRIISLIAVSTLFCCCTQQQKGEDNDSHVNALEAADATREQWNKSKKELEVFVSGTFDKDYIVIYSVPADAAADEALAFSGTKMLLQKDRYVMSNGKLTGDTAATSYVCWPQLSTSAPGQATSLAAPFPPIHSGTLLRKSIADKIQLYYEMKPMFATVRLRLDSQVGPKTLSSLAISGQKIFTQADCDQYAGTWTNLAQDGEPIISVLDKKLTSSFYHDFYLPPYEEQIDLQLYASIDGNNYKTHTIIPYLPISNTIQINLSLEKDGLHVLSSWIERTTRLANSHFESQTEITKGMYLTTSGKFVADYDSTAIAIVYESEGGHGKAIALKDSPGMFVHSSSDVSEKLFPTLDETKKEGSLNLAAKDSVSAQKQVLFSPELTYKETCAFGYADGYTLSNALLAQSTNAKDMTSIISPGTGAYIPSVQELATVIYMQQSSHDAVFQSIGFSSLEGFYHTSCSCTEESAYMYNTTENVFTGNASKKYQEGKIRLFYLF